MKDEITAQKFTGLNFYARKALWDFLGPAKYELIMWNRDGDTKSGTMKSMSVEDQFLLTLLILRRDWDYSQVAMVFDLTEDYVSSTFKTWLQFMYLMFKENEAFFFTETKDIDKSLLPKCFQNNEFRKVRCVIDCTEIFIQSSRYQLLFNQALLIESKLVTNSFSILSFFLAAKTLFFAKTAST